MATFERIRANGRTLILRDPREITVLGQPALTGVEVNREGDEVAGPGVDERRHIVELALVTRRTPLVFDRHTAELVAVSRN